MNWHKIANIILKIIILLLILHALIFPELPQYQEKGMTYRIIGYPLVAFSVYIFKRFAKINKPYPYKIDILLSLIIALDMMGNALGFYGSIEWWDDIMHFLNCTLLTPVIMLIQPIISHKNKIAYFINTLGLVAWLQIAWEVAEYITFITTSNHELMTAYRDTVGDLIFGQIGSILALIILMKNFNFSGINRSSLR